MKSNKIIIVLFFIFAITGLNTTAQVQNKKASGTRTETIKVEGKCGMCETRIEKAAKTEGVTSADWDNTTKILTLVYDPAKVNSDDIQKKIAIVGHDTEKFKADKKVYDSLPGCCKYR